MSGRTAKARRRSVLWAMQSVTVPPRPSWWQRLRRLWRKPARLSVRREYRRALLIAKRRRA